MPTSIEPMRATTGTTPTDDTGWAYEIKWDGMRAIAFCDRGTLRLASSNGIDATVRFPELAPLAASLAASRVILDGEIITFAPDGRPDFGRLQRRMHAGNAVAGGRGSGRPARGLRGVRHALARRPRRDPAALPGPQATAEPAGRSGPDLVGARAGAGVGRRAAGGRGRPGPRGAHRQAHRQPLRGRGAVRARGASSRSGADRSWSSGAGCRATATGRRPSAPCWSATTTTAMVTGRSATPVGSAPASTSGS